MCVRWHIKWMKMKNVLITGGAGFIGSYLIKRMLSEGHNVVCVDNLILGTRSNIEEYQNEENFFFYEMDVENIDKLDALVKEHQIEEVYHLAANSDIQKSAKNPNLDLQNTFSTTYSVLECMRRNDVKKLFFASTSAVYGEKVNEKLTESVGELQPVSYYGAAKLASEAFISSYAHMNDMQILVFRFPNVIGPNLTHGVVFDFIHKLKKNPLELEILGNGTQCKPYLHVEDLIDAIIEFMQRKHYGVEIYNIGVETATTVTEIANLVCEKMQLENVIYRYTGGDIGWKGDVPYFQYNLNKIHERGWKARYNSTEAIRATLNTITI